MATTSPSPDDAISITAEMPARPDDEDLDLFGLTHPGKVRAENQDQFLVATVHPQVVVHGTSLPNADALPLRGTRLATLLVIADGVGGSAGGSEAARVATEAITRYVSSTLRSYHAAGTSTEDEFLESLRAAALEAHSAV
jgi:protein phosphatase